MDRLCLIEQEIEGHACDCRGIVDDNDPDSNPIPVPDGGLAPCLPYACNTLVSSLTATSNAYWPLDDPQLSLTVPSEFRALKGGLSLVPDPILLASSPEFLPADDDQNPPHGYWTLLPEDLAVCDVGEGKRYVYLNYTGPLPIKVLNIPELAEPDREEPRPYQFSCVGISDTVNLSATWAHKWTTTRTFDGFTSTATDDCRVFLSVNRTTQTFETSLASFSATDNSGVFSDIPYNDTEELVVASIKLDAEIAVVEGIETPQYNVTVSVNDAVFTYSVISSNPTPVTVSYSGIDSVKIRSLSGKYLGIAEGANHAEAYLALQRNSVTYQPPEWCPGPSPECLPYDCSAYGNYVAGLNGIVYEVRKPETLSNGQLLERNGGSPLIYQGTPEQAASAYPTVEGELIPGDCFNTRYMAHGNGFGFRFDRALLDANNLPDVTAWWGATKKHITFVCIPPENTLGAYEIQVETGVGSTYDDTTGFGGTPEEVGGSFEFTLGLNTFASSDPDEYRVRFQNNEIGPVLKRADGPIVLSLELEPFYLPSDYQPLGDMPTEWALRDPTFSRGGGGQAGAENPTRPIYGIQGAVRLNGQIITGQAVGTEMPLRNEVGENDQVFRSKYRVLSPDPDSYPAFFANTSVPFTWGAQFLNVLDVILGTGDSIAIHRSFNRNRLNYQKAFYCP